MWQAVCARPSACRASRHAAWMQVSAVRQWEHACSSTSAALALGVAAQPGVHPRGTVSVPRWRSTSAAISQQPVGLFPPKFKTTQLVTRARWPWRSARATRAWANLMRSRKKPHDFSMPPPYAAGGVRAAMSGRSRGTMFPSPQDPNISTPPTRGRGRHGGRVYERHGRQGHEGQLLAEQPVLVRVARPHVVRSLLSFLGSASKALFFKPFK